jgi:hypothetical protein
MIFRHSECGLSRYPAAHENCSFCRVATLVFSSSAPAQKPDTSGWMLSDIHASIQNIIKVPGGLKSDANGVRSAKAGAIV